MPLPRISFRRWIAALALGLLVALFVAGCAGRSERVAEDGDNRFWDRTDVRRREFVDRGDEGAFPEPNGESAKDGVGRVTVATLGDPETAESPEIVRDPFLSASNADTPVRQVGAQVDAPTNTGTRRMRGLLENVDEQLERLRRDLVEDQADDAPSLEWADLPPQSPANVATASELPAKPTTSRRREAVADQDDIWGELEAAAVAAAQRNAAERNTAVKSSETPVVAGEAIAQSDADSGSTVNEDLIVDSIQIRPRRFHTSTFHAISVREVTSNASTELDEPIEDAIDSSVIETISSRRIVPETPAGRSSNEPTTLDGTIAPTPMFETSPFATAESTTGRDALPTEIAAVEPGGLAPPTSPLLVPSAEPSSTEDPADAASPMPLLVPPSQGTPTSESADGDANGLEAFLIDEQPAHEAITALDGNEFGEPAAATTPSSSTMGWWFAGIVVATIAVLFRVRRRLLV